jgi:PTS system nitrogen regulatory IIA component
MNAVAELLSPDDILLDLDVASKRRIFEEVGRLLEQRHGLAQTKVVESLSAREKLGSTGLGPFDAPDGKPVSEMLVLLVPEHANEQHLQILAEVAQLFVDRAFRERLRMCVDARAVYQLFADWPRT